MKKVMMIHPGRVGSTVVAKLFSNNPQVFVAGEIYNDNVNRMSITHGKEWYFLYNDYINFLSYMYNTAIEKCNFFQSNIDSKYYFFEYKPYLKGCGKPINQVVEEMADAGVEKFVFLYRKNYLRRLVSALISFYTGVWHIKNKPTKVTTISIDIARITDGDIGIANKPIVELLDKYYNFFIPDIKKALKNHDFLELIYEDDIEQNYYQGYNKLCDFLNIDKLDVTIDIVRQNPKKLIKIVENYDELYQALKNTEYCKLLND